MVLVFSYYHRTSQLYSIRDTAGHVRWEDGQLRPIQPNGYTYSEDSLKFGYKFHNDVVGQVKRPVLHFKRF